MSRVLGGRRWAKNCEGEDHPSEKARVARIRRALRESGDVPLFVRPPFVGLPLSEGSKKRGHKMDRPNQMGEYTKLNSTR